MKIVFVDGDGPLSNVLTVLAYGSEHRFSADICHILNNVCEAAGAKIVSISTRSVDNHVQNRNWNFELFRLAGLDYRNVHNDWCCRNTDGDRKTAILEWLSRHPEVTDYVIIDDEKVKLPNLVKVNELGNISLRQWERVAKLLKFPLIEAFKIARRKSNDAVSAADYFFEPDINAPQEETVFFLDFDGTVATRRIRMASGDDDTMDAIALQVIGHICSLSGAKVACTSTDVLHDDPDNLKEALHRFEQAGFDIRHLHPDWACRNTRGPREDTILEWLSRHPEVKRHVIIDDGVVNLPHFVRVDQSNGILMDHFAAIAKKVNVSLRQVFQHAGKGTSLTGQLLLPLTQDHEDFNHRLIERGNQP